MTHNLEVVGSSPTWSTYFKNVKSDRLIDKTFAFNKYIPYLCSVVSPYREKHR